MVRPASRSTRRRNRNMAALGKHRKDRKRPRPLPPGTYTMTDCRVVVQLETDPPVIVTTGVVNGQRLQLTERFCIDDRQ
jgi:hypothetical protein